MKGYWSHAKRYSKIYTRSVSFISQCKWKKCTSILIFMLKRWKTPKKSKKSITIFPSRDQCLSLENICHSFLMLHCRWMPWDCKYCETLIFRVTLFSRAHDFGFIHETLFSRLFISCTIILTWEILAWTLFSWVTSLTNLRENKVLANKKCFTVLRLIAIPFLFMPVV